jgi:ankyrin repeat protein
LELVRYFFESDPVFAEEMKRTQVLPALRMAIEFGHADVVRYLLERYAELVPSLEVLNVPTLLHTAARNGKHQVLRVLFEREANASYLRRTAMSSLDSWGNNVLFSTVGSIFGTEDDRVECIRLLLQNGGDMHVMREQSNHSLLASAVYSRSTKVVAMLLHEFNIPLIKHEALTGRFLFEAGVANVTSTKKRSVDPQLFQLLLSQADFSNAVTRENATLLVHRLIEQDGTFRLTRVEEFWKDAPFGDWLVLAAKLGRVPVVRHLLIELNVDIDSVHSKFGTTALMEACAQFNASLVRLLLVRQARTDIRSVDGRVALDFAPPEERERLKQLAAFQQQASKSLSTEDNARLEEMQAV